jgi:hypothetical protein
MYIYIDTRQYLLLTLTSPTSGGRSVGIVRLRTTDTEFSFSYFSIYYKNVPFEICGKIKKRSVREYKRKNAKIFPLVVM